MPAFTYTGTHRETGATDGNVDPSGISMYGLWFARGQNVEVSDAFAARKLAGNAYFRAVPDAVAPAAPAGLPVEAPGDIGAALMSGLSEPVVAMVQELAASVPPHTLIAVRPGGSPPAPKKPRRK